MTSKEAVTNRLIFLEEGDIAELPRDSARTWDRDRHLAVRPATTPAPSASCSTWPTGPPCARTP